MMAAVVAVIMAVAAVLAVGYPLARRSRGRPATAAPEPSDVQRLLDERDSLLGSLRELEAERGMGNVEEAEYRTRREGYERRGVAVLRALDSRAGGLEAEIEKEVRALRLSQSQGPCPQCGAPRRLPDAACPRCGFREGPQA